MNRILQFYHVTRLAKHYGLISKSPFVSYMIRSRIQRIHLNVILTIFCRIVLTFCKLICIHLRTWVSIPIKQWFFQYYIIISLLKHFHSTKKQKKSDNFCIFTFVTINYDNAVILKEYEFLKSLIFRECNFLPSLVVDTQFLRMFVSPHLGCLCPQTDSQRRFFSK